MGLSAARLATLDTAMQAAVEKHEKAGMVVLIAKNGKVAHHRAYGKEKMVALLLAQHTPIDFLFAYTWQTLVYQAIE